MSPPESYYAILYLYKGSGEKPLHALSAELWYGQQAICKIEPIHCFGLTALKIRAFGAQVLPAFSDKYQVSLPTYKEMFELDPIWKLFDEIWETIPVEQQLSIAAQVFAAIAQAIDKRSQQLLRDWSDRTNPIGPTVSEDIFSGLVRTTVQLELEDLKAPTPPQSFKKHSSRSCLKPDDSIAAIVEKEKIRAMVDGIVVGRLRSLSTGRFL